MRKENFDHREMTAPIRQAVKNPPYLGVKSVQLTNPSVKNGHAMLPFSIIQVITIAPVHYG